MPLDLAIPAFIAGFITFFAPCTLPLVPAYISFIGGVSAKELHNNEAKKIKGRILLNGLFYVLGFSVIFILLGSIFGAAGSFLAEERFLLSRIGGVLIIFFGLYLMRVFDRVPLLRFLSQEKRFHVVRYLTPGTPGSSFLFGATFALGWTPCVGPILGSVLLIASTGGTVLSGMGLLALFSLGQALPFLAIALGIDHAGGLLARCNKVLPIVSFVGGVFLVFLGALVATDNLIVFSGTFYQWFDFLNDIHWAKYL